MALASKIFPPGIRIRRITARGVVRNVIALGFAAVLVAVWLQLFAHLIATADDEVLPPANQLDHAAAIKESAAENSSIADKPAAELASVVKPSATEQPANASNKPPKSDHWAFQPLRPVKPPASRDPWIDTPIDAFVLQKLQEHRLAPNPQASRLDLIRRVTFDLIGLPPTPDEVQAFLSDKSDDADAYEQLVDRLLESPHYGERWARHWLDLARYADSDGFEDDYDRPFAYKYRDYVIRSFNEDKPYNRFLMEQLAGDEINPDDPTNLVALGFFACGPTISNQKNEKNRVDEVDDMVSTTGAVCLGLTVGCARCHDHKYEPISQRDYYRMFAVFDNTAKFDDDEIMHVRDPALRRTKPI